MIAHLLGLILATQEPLTIKAITLPEEKTRYAKMEIKVDLRASYVNPFHPAQLDLEAKFVGPRSTEIVVPGFYYQGYSRALIEGKEVLTKGAEGEWRIRFTPPSAGNWYVQVRATDRADKVETAKIRFVVKDSDAPGFLRVATGSQRIEYDDQEDLRRKLLDLKKQKHFHFDNGKPFFGVGLNLAWAGERGTYQFEEWFEKLAKNGGNLARIWSHPGGLGLEWGDKGGRGEFHGLGRYSLDNAWLLDRVLEAAEKHGIKVILCLGTYGELKADKGMWNEQLWDKNPYNLTNGGPCEQPEDFFNDLKARAFYRQRLHYVIARYAYSPAILAWELWNEVKAPAYWVHEMAQELHEIDPYDHAVTTSYGDAAIWSDEYIDLATSHIYGDGAATDLLDRIASGAKLEIGAAVQPNMVTEFGVDYKGPDAAFDPQGLAINLRSGLWQAAACGYAAGTMNWWWDSYVDKMDLWGVFKPFADAVAQVPWSASPMSRADVRLPDGMAGSVVVSEHGGLGWFRQASYNWKDWNPHAKPTLPFLLDISPVKEGLWEAVWWDTHAGKELSRETLKAEDRSIHIRAPSFGSDVALLLVRR